MPTPDKGKQSPDLISRQEVRGCFAAFRLTPEAVCTSEMVGGNVIEQDWENGRPPLEAEAIHEAFRTRFKRLRAIIEDLAYGGLSNQEIAEKYGMEVKQVPVFAATWAEVIDMARWNHYQELKHLLLMAMPLSPDPSIRS
jgi:hypothetical protein